MVIICGHLVRDQSISAREATFRFPAKDSFYGRKPFISGEERPRASIAGLAGGERYP
jgi:hypothetical protein